MSESLLDAEARRARWARHRALERLVTAAGEDFACSGLGAHIENLGLRILFLPGDPDLSAVSLDGALLGVLKESRDAPYGGGAPNWGSWDTATANSLVVLDRYREDKGWTQYLAVHRHGGLDVGIGGLAYENQGTRIFPLRRIVGVAWCAMALQVDLSERYALKGPWELTLALRNTYGATLGMLSEGWAEPHYGFHDFATCIDEHVLMRTEVAVALDPESFAIGVGDQIENAFGSTHRRHLAHRGEFEGRFDPRFSI